MNNPKTINMKLIRILLISILIIGSTNSFNVIAQSNDLSIHKNMAGDLTYSWNAVFDAVSYKIEIEHQVTAQKYSQDTANTTATFSNIPGGTYDIVVTVTKTDGSTDIVIADESEL